MKVVFIGPPGAGKGTHAFMLSKKLKIPHISTGDILREEIHNRTRLGLLAKSFMDKGELVPDEVMVDIVKNRLGKKDARLNGFILDGFPRTKTQALALGNNLDIALYFKTSAAVIISRLAGRLICRRCNANYHIKNIPPKKSGICDTCGGKLYQRKDDREETVRKRLNIYRRQTSSLITYYKQQGILKEVNGDLDLIRLHKIIFNMLKSR